jgi:hypothetical protein
LDKRLPHSNKTKKWQKRRVIDRHGWNTIEDYNRIYHNHLDNHPFIDHSKALPEFTVYSSEEERNIIVTLDGFIYCNNDVLIEIRKVFDTKIVANGILKIRCSSYCYNASIKGNHNILRYDNLDKLSDYHRHVFNSDGKEISRIPMTRQEFPLLHEVIDKVQALF